MQRLEVSGAVQPLYVSLGVKGLRFSFQSHAVFILLLVDYWVFI